MNGFFTPDKDAKGNSTGGGTISWNPHLGLLTNKDVVISPATVLDHEDEHAAGNAKSPADFDKRRRTPDKQYENKEEKHVITGTEQKTAKALGEINKGEKTREDHSGKDAVITNDPTSTAGGIVPLK